MTGQRFGRLVVQYRNEETKKWHCLCDCGGSLYPNCTGEIETKSYSLTHGLTTSCGCVRYEKWREKQNETSAKANQKHKIDLIGKVFGSLTVKEYLGDDWWLCSCICGNDTKKKRSTLLYSNYELKCEKCCYIPKEDLSGNRYGMWLVESYAGQGKYKCVCDCGNKAIVEASKLKSGRSTKCKYHSKDINKLREALVDISPNVDLTSITSNSYVDFICPIHGVYNQQVKQHVRLLDGKLMRGCPKCSGNLGNNGSTPEAHIVDYIKSFYSGIVEIHNTSILDGKELDIYLPEVAIAIEYNGSPFHATLNAIFDDKPKYYHRDKFLLAKSRGVHLISVFDVDYLNNGVVVFDMIKKNVLNIYTHEHPHTNIVITNNDYDSGEWLRDFGYVDTCQLEPESYLYKNEFLVYRSGKTEWHRV